MWPVTGSCQGSAACAATASSMAPARSAGIAAADTAGASGVLSSAAMVDLYSQLYASDRFEAEDKADANLLRDAYVANTAAGRLAATLL